MAEPVDLPNSKRAFLAHMRHELRTPLNAIIGYSELIIEEAQEDGEEALVKDLNKILTAGRHLNDLITDILEHTVKESARA